ncbi:MAG: MEDS domain-containing protein [Candidatus Bipolaricaulota bacterium]|nr:MEDS domain-containing protein [Candidatus Bipolaricaulota bacterium]
MADRQDLPGRGPRVGRTGLGDLRPGDHACLLYRTEEERRDALVLFVRAGLAQSERVVYVGGPPEALEVRSFLAAAGLDVPQAEKGKQLRFIAPDEIFRTGSRCDAQGLGAFLRGEAEGARAEGFSGLRVVVELPAPRGSSRLIAEEGLLDQFFSTSSAIGLCLYDARRHPPSLLLDVLRTHPRVAVGISLSENPFYIPPPDLREGREEEATLERWLGVLAERSWAGLDREVPPHRGEGRAGEILAALARVTQAMVSSGWDLETVCGAIHQAVEELMPAEAFVVSLRTGEDEALAVYLADAGGRYPPEPVPKGEGITWHVLSTGAAVVIPDTAEEAPFKERRFGSQVAVRSLLAVPLRVGERTVGMISTQSYRPRAFTAEDLQALEMFAAPLATVLEITRLVSALRESEERFRRLAESAPDIIFRYRVQPNPGLDYVGPAVARVTGYGPEEFRADPTLWARIVHPEDRPVVEGLARGEGRFGELVPLRVTSKDGRRIWLELLAVPVFDVGGELVAVEGIARDVTARVAAEEKYRRLVEQLPGVVYLLEFDRPFPRKTVYISPRVQELLGWTAEEWLADPELWIQVIEPEDRERVVAAVRELNDARKPFDLTYRVRARDGRRLWIRNLASVFPESGGLARFAQGVMVDVTGEVEQARRASQALDELVEAFSTAMELRDRYTAGHQRRVAGLACAIAEELGLPAERVQGLRVAALLHDIGKALFVPIEILSKPGPLTDLEMALVREHPRAGYEVLKGVEFPWPVAEVVYQHHERLDGSGYPRGLRGEEILLEARILAVADVVEAMATHRPYRPALPLAAALAELRAHRGTLYDPAVVDACDRRWRAGRLPLEGRSPMEAR